MCVCFFSVRFSCAADRWRRYASRRAVPRLSSARRGTADFSHLLSRTQCLSSRSSLSLSSKRRQAPTQTNRPRGRFVDLECNSSQQLSFSVFPPLLLSFVLCHGSGGAVQGRSKRSGGSGTETGAGGRGAGRNREWSRPTPHPILTRLISCARERICKSSIRPSIHPSTDAAIHSFILPSVHPWLCSSIHQLHAAVADAAPRCHRFAKKKSPRQFAIFETRTRFEQLEIHASISFSDD